MSQIEQVDSACKCVDATLPAFPIIISEWERNSREVIRVELDQFGGHFIINARVWFRAEKDLRLTKVGLALSTRHLPQLAAALANALATARHFNLVEETARKARWRHTDSRQSQ